EAVHALARYISTALVPPAPPPPSDRELVALGERVFNDDAVGCAGCHDASLDFTDGARHDVGTVSAAEHAAAQRRTRSRLAERPAPPGLRHAALTAPYLHDGSAATLDELLARTEGTMGNTGQPPPLQRRALLAYLTTL